MATNRVPGPAWRLSWVTSRTVTPASPRTRPPTTPARWARELLVDAIGRHPQSMEGLGHDLREHGCRRLAAGAVLPDRLIQHDRHHQLGVVDRCQADEAGPGRLGVGATFTQLVGGPGLAADPIAGDGGVAAGARLHHSGQKLAHDPGGLR